jgi:hypothetical protein
MRGHQIGIMLGKKSRLQALEQVVIVEGRRELLAGSDMLVAISERVRSLRDAVNSLLQDSVVIAQQVLKRRRKHVLTCRRAHRTQLGAPNLALGCKVHLVLLKFY